MKFSELVKLLGKNDFKIVKEKDLSDSMAIPGGINGLELIIMVQKRFQQVRIKAF